MTLLFSYSTFLKKAVTNKNLLVTASYVYPDSGSNRDGLPHWCLRPARLPIPPSGLLLFSQFEKIDTLKNAAKIKIFRENPKLRANISFLEQFKINEETFIIQKI